MTPTGMEACCCYCNGMGICSYVYLGRFILVLYVWVRILIEKSRATESPYVSMDVPISDG